MLFNLFQNPCNKRNDKNISIKLLILYWNEKWGNLNNSQKDIVLISNNRNIYEPINFRYAIVTFVLVFLIL